MTYDAMYNPARNDVVTIAASSTMVSQRKDRKMYYIQNVSTAGQVITVTLSGGQAAVANYGIVLNPGDCISDSDSGFLYMCFDGDILAISSAANGSLSIVER